MFFHCFTGLQQTFQKFLNSESLLIDIDECSEDIDGCSDMCNNTLGSFDCSCIAGFMLKEDRRTCEGLLIASH